MWGVAYSVACPLGGGTSVPWRCHSAPRSACVLAAQMAGVCAVYRATQKLSYPFAALTIESSVLMFSQELTLYLYLLGN